MIKMPHWPIMLGSKPIELGLERIERLLNKLGNPEKKLPPIIHVAGTNGKGSTIAFMRAILEAVGYKVHVYAQPHLVNFNERIRLAGRFITDQELFDVTEEARIANGEDKITFFEGTTAAALLAFSKVPADIVLLETGMGGREDATNIFKNPAVTAITSIDFDHTDMLGSTISEIAYAKAGIIKEGVPCVVAPQLAEAMKMIEDTAEGLKAPLLRFGKEYRCTFKHTHMLFEDYETNYVLPLPSLQGIHQIMNAGVAIACIKMLRHRFPKTFIITQQHIARGIETAYWPARMQQLKHSPLLEGLPHGWEIWIDGAHNVAGATMLAHQCEHWSDRPLFLIAGFTRNRDVQAFLQPFTDKLSYVYGMKVRAEPLSHSAEHITREAMRAGFHALAIEEFEEAVIHAKSVAPVAGKIIITGSLYLCGDILEQHEALYPKVTS